MNPENVRLVLISGHHFGASTLRGILATPEFKHGFLRFSLILSLHPRKGIDTVGYEDLVPIANQGQIPVQIFSSIRSQEVYKILQKMSHDYLLVIGLSQLVPSAILDLPSWHNNGQQRYSSSYACIGMHPTLLLTGRGRAPIPWTIIHGIQHSGVTSFLLESEADVGAVIDSEAFFVEPGDTATTLFSKVAAAHYELGKRLVHKMVTRSLTWREQEHSKASVWTQRRPSDGWIDFSKSSHEILTLVRALTPPYPGAFFPYKEHIITVLVDVLQILLVIWYQGGPSPSLVSRSSPYEST